MDRIKTIAIPVALIFALYVEVIFIHFPFFFLTSVICLMLWYRVFYLVFIFLLSLILDSLLVNSLGVTAASLFLVIFVLSIFLNKFDFRTRIFTFAVLISSSLIYSILVGYSLHIFVYIILTLMYVGFEIKMRSVRVDLITLWG